MATNEIQELNFAYLLLAQQLLEQDKDMAMFRLKIDSKMADLLLSLSAFQLSRLSRINQMLFRFCIDHEEQLEKLVNNEREQGLSQTHTSLLLAAKPPASPMAP